MTFRGCADCGSEQAIFYFGDSADQPAYCRSCYESREALLETTSRAAPPTPRSAPVVVEMRQEPRSLPPWVEAAAFCDGLATPELPAWVLTAIYTP
jgi:hypothetical protein